MHTDCTTWNTNKTYNTYNTIKAKYMYIICNNSSTTALQATFRTLSIAISTVYAWHMYMTHPHVCVTRNPTDAKSVCGMFTDRTKLKQRQNLKWQITSFHMNGWVSVCQEFTVFTICRQFSIFCFPELPFEKQKPKLHQFSVTLP